MAIRHCPLLSLLSTLLWLAAIFVFLVLRATGSDPEPTAQPAGGGAQCGDYSNRPTGDGSCRLAATLPLVEGGRKCPDVFRCTEEVTYWLRQNEERKQQVLVLRETVSQLQEELRNHRHHLKVLQMKGEDKHVLNSSLELRFHELEVHYAETNTLLHLQDSIIYDLQNQVHNLSDLLEGVSQSPGCIVSIDSTGPGPLMSAQEALHPEEHHVRHCPVDCASIYYNGVRRSGVFSVVPSMGAEPVEVYCDMETEGGGWTVFQRREDGSVSFDRGWEKYRTGFGDLRSEFWLGLEHIHQLTVQGEYSLRIDLEDWSSQHKHAEYHSFSVDGEDSQYRVHVTGFSGTAEDSFGWYHDKQGFSTPDMGNICAQISHAGWWYHQCFYSNLNGVYYRGGRYSPKGRTPLGPDGVVWYSWRDSDYYSLRKVSMMIRPRNYHPRLARSP